MCKFWQAKFDVEIGERNISGFRNLRKTCDRCGINFISFGKFYEDLHSVDKYISAHRGGATTFIRNLAEGKIDHIQFEDSI